MRERFVEVVSDLMDSDESVAVVLAQISSDAFAPAAVRHPHRVIDVGIREQLLVGVAAGLAAEQMRPVAHSYAPFLLERPFEALKTDLGHQGFHAVLVSIGASNDAPEYGRTHECPEDVALIDALTGFEVAVPGHPDEAETLLRHAINGSGSWYVRLSVASNARGRAVVPGRFEVVSRGHTGTVVAVGPMLDVVLRAVAGLEVTVLYASTVRPFDARTLRETLMEPAVVLVEPYLAGTSLGAVARALPDVAHRVLGLGVAEVDLHRFGTRAEHERAHGLDAAGVRRAVTGFL